LNSAAIAGAVRAIGAERVKFLSVITGGHFFIHWFQQLFPVVIPSIKAGLGLDDVQVGALNSARQFTQGTFDLPVGMLSDAQVRRRGLILASALAAMAAAYFLIGAAPSLFWALVGAGLVGLGTSLWHPTAAASLSNKFPDRRATALSIHGIGATVSDTLTPLAVGLLLVTLPWQTVLRLQLVPGLLLAFFVWRALAAFFSDAPRRSWRAAEFRDVYALGKNRAFLGVCAATALLQMGRLSVITFIPIYIQEHLGYSPFALGVYIGLMHAMGTVSQPVLGHLSDRYGRKAVMLPSYTALAILFFLLAFAAPGVQLGLVVSAIGLFFYTLINIANAATMDVAGSHIQGSSFGLTSLINQVVVFPTPIVAGYLVERAGILSAFWLAGIFMLLGAVVLIPLKLYKGTRKSKV
jgi:FSR family fosmidomycin resistance protein-like MFS transporter